MGIEFLPSLSTSGIIISGSGEGTSQLADFAGGFVDNNNIS
jgi:hypothetical protein